VFLDLRGYPVILVDTAGIRESQDPIEQEGVARARRRAESADLTLWLNDGGEDQDPPSLEAPTLPVRTKIDLGGVAKAAARSADLAISAKTGAGVDLMLDVIAELAEERMSSGEPALLTLERHRRGFQDARAALTSVAPDAAELELIAEDLRRAAFAMDQIVGRIGVEDVLGEIFARLCVGK
jgi:tRNA modification GTPase